MFAQRLHERSAPRFRSSSAVARSTALDHWVLSRIRSLVPGAAIRFELWDGFALGPPDDSPVATILLKNRHALVGWLVDPELNFGETYMSGAMEVRGSLHALLTAIYRAMPDSTRRVAWRRRETHDARTARHNVHVHYDLGNDFYRRWLDERMLYSCAFFADPSTTLEAAQTAKLDRVCRKLWLQPGETVVEAGCGWGALALHMAREYGVRVIACNISREQLAYARDRAAREGLADRVTFVEDDYRGLTCSCDAFVSVGMLEHVGLEEFEALGSVIGRVLTPNGRGLLHFIGRDRPEPLNAWIRRRIFPGAHPPTLRDVCERVFEPARFSVLDVENLRLHYAATLRHWLERFERSAADVAAAFDETFVRAWRLYLVGSQVGFETGSLQLFQAVFARRGSTAIPWVRAS
jgi:cyclopropane-fatty-acyl-phospholipid synthase